MNVNRWELYLEAALFYYATDNASAETFFQRAQQSAIFETGPESAAVALVLDHTAEFFLRKGRLKEAQTYEDRARDILCSYGRTGID